MSEPYDRWRQTISNGHNRRQNRDATARAGRSTLVIDTTGPIRPMRELTTAEAAEYLGTHTDYVAKVKGIVWRWARATGPGGRRIKAWCMASLQAERARRHQAKQAREERGTPEARAKRKEIAADAHRAALLASRPVYQATPPRAPRSRFDLLPRKRRDETTIEDAARLAGFTVADMRKAPIRWRWVRVDGADGDAPTAALVTPWYDAQKTAVLAREVAALRARGVSEADIPREIKANERRG